MTETSKDKWYNLHKEFLSRFPLDSLKTMPIEKYTNLNKSDSFCFWLESETYELGSIWGGAAYKFGIFKFDKEPKDKNNPFDDQYAWYKKHGATRDIAYKNVLEGLCSIAEAAAIGDYQIVEDNNTYGEACKWKIAFLYSGMKIIPIYNKSMMCRLANYYGMQNSATATMKEMQDYMVKKQGDKDLFDFTNELLAVYETLIADGNVWMIMGDVDTLKKPIIEMGNSVSSGLKDYSSFTSIEELGKKFREVKGNTDVKVPFAYWQFIKDVKIGDVVAVFSNKIMYGKNSHVIYGWGVITSELINDIASENPLQRKVEWKKLLDEPILDNKTRNSMFFHGTTKEQAENIKQLLSITEQQNQTFSMESLQTYIDLLLENRNLVLTGAPGTGKTYLAKEIAKALGCTEEEMCFVQFHPSYDYTDFVEGLRPVNANDGQIAFERKDGVFKKFCKKALFEESTNCNPFEIYWKKLKNYIYKAKKPIAITISGILNIYIGWDEENEVLEVSDSRYFEGKFINASYYSFQCEDLYKIYSGTISPYDFSGNAYQVAYGEAIITFMEEKLNLPRYPLCSDKPQVFIIDEINRGDLSKIFGELFFCIDPGYRGKKGIVQTQYQNMIDPNDIFSNGFYIPENVYIIATMNDIDRSVESMDFAMRRRFAWYEVDPTKRIDMLDKLESYKDEAVRRMNRLNNAIKEELGTAYQIGPAYFLKLKDGDFDTLWRMNLRPLLHEYLRGTRNPESTLKMFEDCYYNVAVTF